MTYAILPYGQEFCVAHVGTALVPGTDRYTAAWVVDQVCPTVDQAITAQNNFVKAARVRAASVKADLRSLGIRHG